MTQTLPAPHPYPELGPTEHAPTDPQTVKAIGRAGSSPNVRVAPEQLPLPAGYRFEDMSQIDPIEVVSLFRKVEMGQDIADDYLPGRNKRLQEHGASVVDVGVRDPAGSLVGFGSVAYAGEIGELGDFVVDPGHQRKGIGKAILLRRLALAEELGVTQLSMPYLEPTNTLRSFYTENGFREGEYGRFVRDSSSG